MADYLTEMFSVRLEKATLADLERLARLNDRTTAQEARRALRLHLLGHEAQLGENRSEEAVA